MQAQNSATNTLARTVAVQHEIARRADEIRRAMDPSIMPQTPDEWTARLVGSLGCIACAIEHRELEHYVIEHAATLMVWLEDMAREAAH